VRSLDAYVGSLVKLRRSQSASCQIVLKYALDVSYAPRGCACTLQQHTLTPRTPEPMLPLHCRSLFASFVAAEAAYTQVVLRQRPPAASYPTCSMLCHQYLNLHTHPLDLLPWCRLMSDWKVELVEDNISEFYVEIGGPKDSECSCKSQCPAVASCTACIVQAGFPGLGGTHRSQLGT
jgi:hypothetical protein